VFLRVTVHQCNKSIKTNNELQILILLTIFPKILLLFTKLSSGVIVWKDQEVPTYRGMHWYFISVAYQQVSLKVTLYVVEKC